MQGLDETFNGNGSHEVMGNDRKWPALLAEIAFLGLSIGVVPQAESIGFNEESFSNEV